MAYSTGKAEMKTIKKVEVYVDREFGLDLKKALEEEIKEYNMVFNGGIRFEIVDWDFNMEIEKLKGIESRGIVILKVGEGSAILGDKVGEKTLERCNAVGGWKMWIAEDRIGKEDYKGVIRHGLGHLMGASHMEGGLMSRIYNRDQYKCVDAGSAKQMGDYLGIDWRGMNYCS